MASDFQPGEPYEDTKGPTPAAKSASLVAAAVSALLVVMIMAIWSPRILESTAANWGVTLGAAAVVFVVVLLAWRARPS